VRTSLCPDPRRHEEIHGLFGLLLTSSNSLFSLLPVSACFFFHLSGSEEKQGDTGKGRNGAEGGWQGVSESAVSAKRGGLVWRETGAVRNARRAGAKRRPYEETAVKEKMA